MTRLERLQAMLGCLQQMLDKYPKCEVRQPGEKFVSRFLCHRAWDTNSSAPAISDVRQLIRRALAPASCLEDWYEITQARRFPERQKLSLRRKWLRKLIRDCKAEIKAEQARHASSN